jgi:hypothetical protein
MIDSQSRVVKLGNLLPNSQVVQVFPGRQIFTINNLQVKPIFQKTPEFSKICQTNKKTPV